MFILRIPLWGGCHYWPHFKEENWDTERASNVIQVHTANKQWNWVWTHTICLQSLCSPPLHHPDSHGGRVPSKPQNCRNWRTEEIKAVTIVQTNPYLWGTPQNILEWGTHMSSSVKFPQNTANCLKVMQNWGWKSGETKDVIKGKLIFSKWFPELWLFV